MMVEFENRQPAEGVNVTAVHPLKQFLRLAIAALVLIVVLVFIVQFAAAFLARLVPFSVEKRVMTRLDLDFGDTAADSDMPRYLNALADRLVPLLELPDGMDVTVHYDSSDTFNAYATVGGNLLFYRGLLAKLPNENALAMVMAHEIAHVLHRDPVAGLGGGVASALVLAAVTGNAGTGAAADVLSTAGLLTGVQFTRRMEKQADRAAAAAVGTLYGHMNGAGMLFESIADARQLKDDRSLLWLERFAATHPLDTDRIEAIAERARELGFSMDGETTALPEAFEHWL